MATLAQLGIPGSGTGILQPKQRYRWLARFVGIGKLAGSLNTSDLTRQLTNFSKPSLEFNSIEQHRYNSVSYVAGKHTFQPVSITLEDDITGLASNVVQAQLETQQRLIGADLNGEWLNAAATGSNYKFAMFLDLLDGNDGVVEKWTFEGCWILSADWGDLDYSSSDASTIQLSIRYDHTRQELFGAGYGTALGGFA